MPASKTAVGDDRFRSLTPSSLSRSEKSTIVTLALAVLSQRFLPGRSFASPNDVQNFLRLKLTGRRNEVFGVIYLDTRHRLIEIEELFSGTVDGATVYPTHCAAEAYRVGGNNRRRTGVARQQTGNKGDRHETPEDDETANG